MGVPKSDGPSAHLTGTDLQGDWRVGNSVGCGVNNQTGDVELMFDIYSASRVEQVGWIFIELDDAAGFANAILAEVEIARGR